MKHKLQLIAVMALAFLAASCQRENLEPVAGGSTVTYTVQIPDAIATKAIGDGHSGVTKLIYEVYREAQLADLNAAPIYEGEAEINDQGVAALELEFVKNQKFTVLFWAQNPDVDVYTTDDLRNVRLAQTLTANNVNTAVFAGSDKVDNCVSAANGAVDLVRPIAQLRIGTTPESLVIRSTTTVTLIKSDLKVKGLSTTYNVATKAAGADKSEFTYSEADVPAETFKANNVDYQYVAMSYVGFASDLGANIDVEFNINTSEGVISHEVVNVPVKPNYRTNIVGNLITASADYNVSIEDNWETTEHNVKVVTVSDAQGLQAAIDNSEPGTETNVKLEGDIDLGALAGLISTKADETPATPTYGLLIPAGKALVLDLNGCTLSQTVEQTAGYSMILNNGTLTIDDSKGNGKISYTDSGYGGEYVSNTITNNGTLTVKSGTIVNASADAVGGPGYPYAIDSRQSGATEVVLNIEGGTIKSSYSPLRVGAHNSSVNNVANITGGDFYGRLDFQQLTDGGKAELNISGGTFNQFGIKQYVLLVFGGNNYENTDASGVKANITGGKFNAGFSFSTGNPIGSNFNKKFISGGEFSFDPSEYLAEGYFAKQEDSKYVVYKAVAAIGEIMYKSIEDAIEAVGTSATITVLCDAEMAAKTIAAGKEIVLDLNENTVSSISTATGNNYNMLDVRGTLTVKNGTITTKHTGKNMEWNNSTNVFNVTAGGVLNLENVVAKNLGGSDMAYVAHLNNWGEVTLNVTNSTLESTYIAVRVFNSGYDMNNVTIENSTLKGKYAFWVHNYTAVDFGTQEKADAQAKLLNFDIFGNANQFIGQNDTPILYGFNDAVYFEADGSPVLQSVANLKWFANYINTGNNFKDKTAKLAADIDLAGAEWIPIGTKNNHFHGTFDGQGHTISNFKITQKHDGDNAQAALFGTVSLTTVFKNFNIDNIQVLYPADYNGDYYGAAVIGTFYGNVTLQNINVTKSTIQGNNKVAGLIAHDGSSSKVLIENCNVNGCTIETKNEEDGGNVGGLVGLFQNTKATVENCSVTGCTINAINSSDSGKRGNALLVGGTIDSGTPDLYVIIKNCKVADNTFNETGRVNYVSPYGDGTLVGGAREGSSYVIGKVEIDGVVYPQN